MLQRMLLLVALQLASIRLHDRARSNDHTRIQRCDRFSITPQLII